MTGPTRLEVWRKSAGLSQGELAKKAFCTAMTISNAERRAFRPHQNTIHALIILSGGFLKDADFPKIERKPRSVPNGGKKKAQRKTGNVKQTERRAV